MLYFTDVLWPEFSIWNFLAAIIHFQRHALSISAEKVYSETQIKFLEQLENRKWEELEKIIRC